MRRLVHITTVPQTANTFLSGQLAWLREQGYEITVISSPGEQLKELAAREKVAVAPLEMQRAITPWHDLRTVPSLVRQLDQLQPDIVHAHTPKAGLLGMLAASQCRQSAPVRIYHLHGLRFETMRGWRHQLLRAAERTTCRLADRVFCVSSSLRARAEEEGLLRRGSAQVLCHGSVNGIDLSLFPHERQRAALRMEVRQRLGISADAICLGFVGRLVRDKGVAELVQAWQQLRDRYPELHLLVVGPFEKEDPVPESLRAALEQDRRVHLIGADWSPIPYYAAMDLFTLPTYREGLGNVLLEAAAMQLPIVTCRVTGCVDAVAADRNALLVPPGDASALAAALGQYLDSPALRRTHGTTGRQWVQQRFAPLRIWQALEREYSALLEQRSPLRRRLVEFQRPKHSAACSSLAKR